jgi:O-antigen ligase
MFCFSPVSAILALLTSFDSIYINYLFDFVPYAAVFRNLNHYGYYACCSLMCAAALYIDAKRTTGKLSDRNNSGMRPIVSQILYIAEIAIISYVVAQNGSFGPLLAVITGFLGCIAVFTCFRRERLRRAVVAAIVFAAMVTISNLQTGRFISDIKALAGDVKEIAERRDEAAEAGSGRWKIWKAGVQFALERPLFGYGPDNLGERYREVGLEKFDRPHNELIQFAASLCIPAMLFYLAGLASHLIRFFRAGKKLSTLTLGLFCAVGAYLVSSLFGNTMYYTSPFFFMLLGMSAGMLKNEAQPSSA